MVQFENWDISQFENPKMKLFVIVYAFDSNSMLIHFQIFKLFNLQITGTCSTLEERYTPCQLL